MRRTDPARRSARLVARLGLLIAAAFVLSWVELLLPLPVGVPGVKLGLCHIVVLYALYRLSLREAATVSLVRVLLSFLLFGTVMSLIYSLAGATVSLLTMYLLKRTDKFSVAAVSVAGAVCHNLTQLACAALLLHTDGLLWYAPVLMVSAVVTGVAVGVAGKAIVTFGQ